jgi:hypothetical protein
VWRAVACAALPSPSARQIYAVRGLLAIFLMLWLSFLILFNSLSIFVVL